MKLGIDFGTTRTVVSVHDRGNFPVVGFETPQGDVVDFFPSVIATDGARRWSGHEASSRLGAPGVRGLRSFKRLLCRTGAGPDQPVRLGEQELSMFELLGGFLRDLREALLERSNLPPTLGEGEALEALIAVPAGASSAQRFVTLEAFRAAGFEVVGVMNEPSAAGIEYAHRYRKTLTSNREEVLVYDLGGGTFDASLVRMGEGRHRVLAHAGLQDLGGDDFDGVLLELALAEVGRERASLADEDELRLLEHCRQQKEGLNPNSRKVVVELDEETTVTLATADLYAACAPLVARSVETLQRVLSRGDDGELATDGLAGVYVVGGASDLPVVARTLREVFGRRVKRSAYPSASIAVGLAIALADREVPVLEERFSRTFGVFRELSGGADVGFDAILAAGLELDRDGGSLVRRYRAAHNIGHFRFVECDRVDGGVPVGDLVPFGELRFPFDPALRDAADLDTVPVQRRTAPGPLVEERYTIDPSGIVEVSITDLDSGYRRQHRLTL